MLAGLVNVLNPERIILGGGVAQAGAFLFGPVREAIKKKAFPIASQFVKVMPAKLGPDAGLVGAAALTFSAR
jgi:glucokinase